MTPNALPESDPPAATIEPIIADEERGLASPTTGPAPGLLSSILNSSADGLLVIDRAGKILAWNDRFRTMWNIPQGIMETRADEAALEAVLDQIVDPQAFLARVRELYAQPREESFETILLRDGRTFERFSRPLGREGEAHGRVWSFRDVTRQRGAERSMRETEMKFHAFAEGAACGLLIYQNDTIVFANSWVREVFGETLGRPFWSNVHPDDLEGAIQRGRARALGQPMEGHSDIRMIDRHGATRWLEITGTTIELDGSRAVLTTAYDVTKRREAEERTRHVAFHDALTDLPNRALFNERAGRALAAGRRDGGSTGVILLDLDRFKNVNDSLGHDAGDELIRQSAARLRGGLRASDTVARLGGDEFAILLPGHGSEAAVRVALKLLAAMRDPFQVVGRELRVTASLGVAISPGDGDDVQTLVKSADTAMYRAKDAGRDRLQVFDPTMNLAAVKRLEMENELHEGLARDEFVMFYQPIYRARTAEVTGFEALVRWQRPDGSLREPDAFVPMAESTGLILPIGRFVLRTACRDLALMREAVGADLRMSVNVAAAQLRDSDIVGLVTTCLADSNLEPGALELEITESSALQGQETTLAALRALAELGIALTLDDFGTGYASLDLLRRLPIHRIKIDRSFVQDVGADRVDEAIASSTIALAHQLGLEVVGEGVETEFQKRFLEDQGCDLLQGHLLGHAAPRDEIMTRLREAGPAAAAPTRGD